MHCSAAWGWTLLFVFFILFSFQSEDKWLLPEDTFKHFVLCDLLIWLFESVIGHRSQNSSWAQMKFHDRGSFWQNLLNFRYSTEEETISMLFQHTFLQNQGALRAVMHGFQTVFLLLTISVWVDYSHRGWSLIPFITLLFLYNLGFFLCRSLYIFKSAWAYCLNESVFSSPLLSWTCTKKRCIFSNQESSFCSVGTEGSLINIFWSGFHLFPCNVNTFNVVRGRLFCCP